MKFSPTTQLHDIKHKLKHIERFLNEGEKVRVTVHFTGRELAFPETGKALLTQVINLVPQVIVDKEPTLEGRNMSAILSRKQAKKTDANRK